VVVCNGSPLVEVVALNKVLKVHKQSLVEGEIACGAHSDGNVDQLDLGEGSNVGDGLDEGRRTSVR
jgi:hypothetical protein